MVVQEEQYMPLSKQYVDIMKANEGKKLDIKMFPRDMWLSQLELNHFMQKERAQMKLSEVQYHCAINQTCIPYWANM